MSRRLAVLALALSLASAPLHAQDAAPRPVSPGALRAAEELLPLMNAEAQVRAGIEAALDAQVEAQPLMAPFRPTMQAWAERYITWAELGPRLARVYAEEFTEAELRDLIAFYRTPVGQKVATLTPTLSRRFAEAGEEMAREHVGELQEMIQARAAELGMPGAGAGTP